MTHNTHEDEIHLPSPSMAPLLVAGGVALSLLGLLSPIMLFGGIMILAVGIGMWLFAPV